MKESIKYSVIVPIYNTEKYLEDCLNSVLSVERDDIEVIAIDDGSKDNSFFILNNIAQKDSRLRVFNQKNSGVSVARNNGIIMARGEWILFLDSDDYFTKSPFEEFDRMIRLYPDCRMFYHSTKIKKEMDITDNREDLILVTLGTKGETNEYSSISALASVWGKLYNRNIFNDGKCLFDPDLVMGEDMFFNIQIQAVIDKIAFFNTNFYYYRYNEASTSHGYNPNIPRRDLIFQKKIREFSENYNFKKVRVDGCKSSALGGITVCCNSCFYKYPLLQYKESKRDFRVFINNKIYREALEKVDYHNYDLLHRVIFWCLKNDLYFPGYFIRNVINVFSKNKNRKGQKL